MNIKKDAKELPVDPLIGGKEYESLKRSDDKRGALLGGTKAPAGYITTSASWRRERGMGKRTLREVGTSRSCPALNKRIVRRRNFISRISEFLRNGVNRVQIRLKKGTPPREPEITDTQAIEKNDKMGNDKHQGSKPRPDPWELRWGEKRWRR